MDPVAIEFPAMNNPYDLRIGMVFKSDATARAFVNAHAINNNFAVKNGVVKDKDETLLLVCKCNRKPLNTDVPEAKNIMEWLIIMAQE
ncbi:hypothetical protein V1506DRAFT_514954 [Lipomyces tetrasporus]